MRTLTFPAALADAEVVQISVSQDYCGGVVLPLVREAVKASDLHTLAPPATYGLGAWEACVDGVLLWSYDDEVLTIY